MMVIIIYMYLNFTYQYIICYFLHCDHTFCMVFDE